jgi:hypothetical protein
MRGIFLFAVLAAGCGSMNSSTPVNNPTPPQSIPNATITGHQMSQSKLAQKFGKHFAAIRRSLC